MSELKWFAHFSRCFPSFNYGDCTFFMDNKSAIKQNIIYLWGMTTTSKSDIVL